ncbi:hypothetical protein C8F01DRAFT_1321815 [Mycena amicta]|nr:hypothetical protein C8F01DRAFT_1321815 [Mycena amicta]
MAASLNLDETYGALYIGVLFATFFQGVLTVQVYIYYTNFPGDSRWLKTLVASVWILDTTHLVLIAQTTYYYLVTSWGDQAALLASTTPLILQMLFVSLPALLCNIFFLYRVWVFSNHNWLTTGLLACGCLTGFCFEVAIIGQLLRRPIVTTFPQQTTKVEFGFGVLASMYCFVGLMGSPPHQLYSAPSNAVTRRFSFVQGVQPNSRSIVVLGTLVAHLLAPDKFIFIAIYFSSGRMYTNALLVSLNARRSPRSAMQQPFSTVEIGAWVGPTSLVLHQINSVCLNMSPNPFTNFLVT